MKFILFLCATAFFALTGAESSGIPVGYSTFFDGSTCPEGWSELKEAKGRFVVSVSSATDAGVTVNTPLKPQEVRHHRHGYSTTVRVPVKYAMWALDWEESGAGEHGDYRVNGKSDPSQSGYPTMQMLLCTFIDESKGADYVLPGYAVGFFSPSTRTCPFQWSPTNDINGRVLIPGYDDRNVHNSSAPAYASGEDRKHTHAYSTDRVALRDHSFAGLEGDPSDNNHPAKNTPITVAGTTAEASTGMPYIQLLTCVKSSSQVAQAKLPPGANFFSTFVCPEPETRSERTQGHIPVALPDGGQPLFTPPGVSPFPNPSSTGKSSSGPTHSHTIRGSFNLPGAYVSLADDCCTTGWAKSGTYSFSVASDSVALEAEFPFTMMPFCKAPSQQNVKEDL